MHEIITVQLGQQSNYLAAHFWNAQESYFTYSEDQEPLVNHDVHWRPGLGADGSETFMPRTVIYDLKGGFGSLKKINSLYEIDGDGSSQGLWNGQAVVHRQEPIAPSAYQQSLDAGLQPPELRPDTVRYWSDFNRVFFHPRSAVQLNEYELNSSLAPFEKWATGEDLFSSLDKEHDLLDRDVRPFAEEADQMQGIQIMASFDDAWGGFASDYIERLRDEYGKADIWVWGLQESLHGIPRDKRLLRFANKAKTLVEMYRHASIIAPVTLPERPGSRVALDASSYWHTSALLVSAIETVTLPSRLRNRDNCETLGGMTSLLDTMGNRSITTLRMSVDPQTAQHEDTRRQQTPVGEDGEQEGLRLDLDLSPSDQIESAHRMNGHHKPHIFSQVVVSRGQVGDGTAAEDERVRRRDHNKTISKRYETSLQFPLPDSFPKIFLDSGGNPRQHSVRVTASLTTDTGVSDKLKRLRTTVARSIGLPDREALSSDLADMADEYHEGWSSGSDEGEDD